MYAGWNIRWVISERTDEDIENEIKLPQSLTTSLAVKLPRTQMVNAALAMRLGRWKHLPQHSHGDPAGGNVQRKAVPHDPSNQNTAQPQAYYNLNLTSYLR